MAALKLTGCMKLVSSMDESDQDALLGRLDQYQKDGIPAARAQVMAASDTLAELEAERKEFMAMLREQHPDLFLIKPEAPSNQDIAKSATRYFEDIPNEDWLQGKIDYASKAPRSKYGVPKMGSITGYFKGNVMVPVRWVKDVPGENGEQSQVREKDLEAIRKILRETGKMPLTDSGKEYVPYIEIGYDGKPWVSEGNHRIMAAAAEGWDYIPAEVRYFDGGQRRAGKWAPDNLLDITERQAGDSIAKSTQRNSLGFYSALAKGIEDMPTKAAPAGAWKAQIKGLVNKGAIKQDEVTWSGLEDWLDLEGAPKPVLESGFGLVDEQKMEDGSWVQVDDMGHYARTKEEAEAAITDQMREMSQKWAQKDGTEGRISVKEFPGEQLDFGKTTTPKISKEQILDYLKGNGVQVQEVTLGISGMTPKYQEEIRELQDLRRRADEGEEGVIDEDEIDRLRQLEQHAGHQSPTKYKKYTLPGGESYREVLLTLPDGLKAAPEQAERMQVVKRDDGNWDVVDKDGVVKSFRDWSEATGYAYDQQQAENIRRNLEWQRNQPSVYKSSHWDQANVVAHIRLNDRTDADGKRVLFVEELQSDWGQDGKKHGFDTKPVKVVQKDGLWGTEYQGDFVASVSEERAREEARQLNVVKGGSVPPAPFITKTEGWLNLALKRVMAMAVDGGYDKVAFVNGEQSADRYDLSKQIASVQYLDNSSGGVGIPSLDGPPGRGTLIARDHNDKKVIERHISDPSEIENYVGKEVASKLFQQTPKVTRSAGIGFRAHDLSGVDLKVGGEGMRKFYDSIVPNAVRDLLKKLKTGAELGQVGILAGVDSSMDPDYGTPRFNPDKYNMDDEGRVLREQPGFDVTDAMKEKVGQGLPLFSRQRPYDEAPDNLMGYRKNGPQKAFADSNYKHVEFVRVSWDDGTSMVEAMRGLNKPHALERARRNWKDAEITGITREEAEAEDPGIGADVDAAMRKGISLSTQRQTDTTEFKTWSEDLPVIEGGGNYEGGPAVFVAYHGTTHNDITDFKRVGASEGFLGKGPYFTTDPDDASENYAGVGPDLTSRISREKEMLADSFESDNSVAWDMLQDYFDDNNIEEEITDENLDELKDQYEGDALEHAAIKNLKGKSDGLMMKTFVKLTNPADASGNQMLDYNRIENDDGDIEDETGTAVDWVLKARDIGERYGMGRDMERHIDDVLELASDGEVSMKEIFDSAVKRLNEAYDDNGELLSGGAIFSEIAEELGYDGIIMDAGDHFGPGRRGPMGITVIGMKGVKTDTLHIVPFSSNQVKSATGNNGDFSLKKNDITKSNERTTGDYGRQYTPQQLMMFKNTGRTTSKPTLIERVKEARKDIGKKMAQGLVDQFRPLRDLGGQAYTLARLSKGAAGAFEALLQHGKLSITDGAYDADMTGGFIQQVGEPLGADVEDFLWWMAANRAERLKAEDRENLFTDDDIAAGKSLATGQMTKDYTLANGQVTRDRALAYSDALKKFDAFNKNVLDIAEQSGLIDGDSRQYWEGEFYVPFYRVSEDDGEFVGAKIKGGLARQRAFHELKGGSQKLNSDLLANTMKNWAHLIDASAKNRAAKATLESSVNVGIALEADEETVRQLGKSISGKGGTVWFMDGGQKRHFLVGDPYVLEAINSLEYAGMRGPLMDALSTMKHWLTVGVTASPAFKVRNLIRDSLQAISLSGLSYNPIENLRDGYRASDRNSQEYVSALASGGLIRFGTMAEGNASENVRRLVKKGVSPATILDNEGKLKAFYGQYIEPAIEAYQEIGNRGEEINRAALYSQLRKQNISHSEAALMARDLMDFNMQGTWGSIRFLTQVVPFMNARLQGLYKLGRAAQEDPRRFAMVTGAVALASIALLAAYGDDDDWKKREEWDRDQFWWFKFGGTAFRIPKPFEIGAMASLAERGVELFTNDKFTAKQFGDRVLHLLGDNLAMNPIPQAVKPIIDVYANKDAFSGRPIESMGMERLQSEYRYNSSTSMVARGISTAMNAATRATTGTDALSPVQVDSLLRGYFGWLGTFVVAGADMAVRPLTNEPTRPQADYLKVVTQGFLKSLPEDQSKYVSALYDQAKILEEAYATHRQLIKEGKVDDAREFAAENKDLLERYLRVEAIKKTQATINQKVRAIEISDMDPAKKREEINRLRQQASASAEKVY